MGIIITSENRQRWENAYAKALALNPRVYTLAFGKFEVEGNNDDYVVTWVNGQPNCTCPAGRAEQPCYHQCATESHYERQVADLAGKPTPYDYALKALDEAKTAMEKERDAWLASGGRNPELENLREGATAECSDCGKKFPEAGMTGPGYALVCDDCRSARSTTIHISWPSRPGRFKEDE